MGAKGGEELEGLIMEEVSEALNTNRDKWGKSLDGKLVWAGSLIHWFVTRTGLGEGVKRDVALSYGAPWGQQRRALW